MYGEDADLAARARKRGYHPAITPEAVILHHVGASSLSVDKREMNLRCRVALARKHWSPGRAAAAVALLQAGTGRARARCRGHAPPVVDLARRLATAPGLARRLRLRRRRSPRRPVMTSAGASPGHRASFRPWRAPSRAAWRPDGSHRSTAGTSISSNARAVSWTRSTSSSCTSPTMCSRPSCEPAGSATPLPSIRRYRCTRSRPATTPPKPCVGASPSEPDLCFTGKGHDGWSAALALQPSWPLPVKQRSGSEARRPRALRRGRRRPGPRAPVPADARQRRRGSSRFAARARAHRRARARRRRERVARPRAFDEVLRGGTVEPSATAPNSAPWAERCPMAGRSASAEFTGRPGGRRTSQA